MSEIRRFPFIGEQTRDITGPTPPDNAGIAPSSLRKKEIPRMQLAQLPPGNASIRNLMSSPPIRRAFMLATTWRAIVFQHVFQPVLAVSIKRLDVASPYLFVTFTDVAVTRHDSTSTSQCNTRGFAVAMEKRAPHPRRFCRHCRD